MPGGAAGLCFLADWFLRQRGLCYQVELVYVMLLDAAFTKLVGAEQLRRRAGEKGDRARA